jgi:hypothetical protein
MTTTTILIEKSRIQILEKACNELNIEYKGTEPYESSKLAKAVISYTYDSMLFQLGQMVQLLAQMA